MILSVSQQEQHWTIQRNSETETQLEMPQGESLSQCLMVWEGFDPDKPSDRMLILPLKQGDQPLLTMYETPRLIGLPGVDVWGPDGKIVPIVHIFEGESILLTSEGGRSIHMAAVGIKDNKVDVICTGFVLDFISDSED